MYTLFFLLIHMFMEHIEDLISITTTWSKNSHNHVDILGLTKLTCYMKVQLNYSSEGHVPEKAKRHKTLQTLTSRVLAVILNHTL